ncbi:hypothetical protein GF338_12435, partial [candidate division WOR-3 bacterium]|nr:hypothetical protein [candidate division WOR-3 bacterium]
MKRGRQNYWRRRSSRKTTQGGCMKNSTYVILVCLTIIFTGFAQVTEEWVARYDGIESGGDQANSIAVDDAGNVYVTGQSGWDYATVKYNSSGVEEWTARYDGPGTNYLNKPNAIAIDNSGNIYVTGQSGQYSPEPDYDYATVKYNPEGEKLWVTRYAGPGNYEDCAYALAVDGAGNVYVTGYSYGLGTDSDFATVMYNSSGEEQWVARYDKPGSVKDGAFDIAIDSTGNVYVTGVSWDPETGRDYLTVKYNSEGEVLWTASYDGPVSDEDLAKAIAVDGEGNVYVTGSSIGIWTNGYATVKYNSEGIQQWVSRYEDGASVAIAIDDACNVFVTGSRATVKYNTSGEEQWVNSGGTSIVTDAADNVYVGSGRGDDYTTDKYNNSGEKQWVVKYDGPANGVDWVSAVAVDDDGNVYVTGSSEGSGTYADYATIKYNSLGIEEWVTRYDSQVSSSDG